MASDDKLLPPGEVAELFGVGIKTIARWANTGKLSSIRTVGGHRRFRQSDVDDLLNQLSDNN